MWRTAVMCLVIGCASRVELPRDVPDAQSDGTWSVDSSIDTGAEPVCDWDAPVADATWASYAKTSGCGVTTAAGSNKCECTADDYHLELEGDGEMQVLRYGHRVLSRCEPDGVVTTLDCLEDRVSACGTSTRDRSCLLVANEHPDTCLKVPRGQYIDREGRCWTLTRTDITYDAGPVGPGAAITGTFTATATLDSRELHLRGTFRACFYPARPCE